MAITYKKFIAQAIDLFAQRSDINLQLKALKEAIANANMNPKAVMATATAIYNESLEDLEDYTDSVAEVISEYRSEYQGKKND